MTEKLIVRQGTLSLIGDDGEFFVSKMIGKREATGSLMCAADNGTLILGDEEYDLSATDCATVSRWEAKYDV